MIFCFECNSIERKPIDNYKINEIANKLLLAANEFMPEMHLKMSEFTYSACGPLLKANKELTNLKKQEIQNIFTKMN